MATVSQPQIFILPHHIDYFFSPDEREQEEVDTAINDTDEMTQTRDNSAWETVTDASVNESLNVSVSGSSVNECPECQKAFKSKQTLKVHLNAEHYGKRISCQQCPKEFKYSHQLKMHVKKQHGDEEAEHGMNRK